MKMSKKNAKKILAALDESGRSINVKFGDTRIFKGQYVVMYHYIDDAFWVTEGWCQQDVTSAQLIGSVDGRSLYLEEIDKFSNEVENEITKYRYHMDFPKTWIWGFMKKGVDNLVEMSRLCWSRKYGVKFDRTPRDEHAAEAATYILKLGRKVPDYVYDLDEDLPSNVIYTNNKLMREEEQAVYSAFGLVEAVKRINYKMTGEPSKEVCKKLYASGELEVYSDIQDWEVYSWYQEKEEAKIWDKPQRVYGPTGASKGFTWREFVDKIIPEDLAGSKKPEKVIEKMKERLEKEVKEKQSKEETYDFPQAPWESFGGVQQLLNSYELRKEAEIQDNCVAGYGPVCARGETFVFGVDAPNGDHATMEITPNGGMIQLLSYGNSTPSDEVRSTVKAWMAENNRQGWHLSMERKETHRKDFQENVSSEWSEYDQYPAFAPIWA